MILFKFKIKSIGILIHYYILQNKMHAIFGDIVIPDFRHFDDGLSKNDAQIQGQKPDNFIDSLFNNENIDRKFNEFESDKQKNEEIHLMKDSKKKIKSMKRKNNPGKEKKNPSTKNAKKDEEMHIDYVVDKVFGYYDYSEHSNDENDEYDEVVILSD